MFFQSWSDFINMGGYGFMCGFPTALVSSGTIILAIQSVKGA